MACRHLEEYLSSAGHLDSYKLIVQMVVSPCTASALENKARKLSSCMVCGSGQNSSTRLFACLSCVHISCSKLSGSRTSTNREEDAVGHREAHLRDKGHHLSVETTSGSVYCSSRECSDYVYSPELESVLEKQTRKSSSRLSGSVRYTPWKPSASEVALLRRHKGRRSFSKPAVLGLRGLINLGNTCFMSCIVQTLIHTPLLRDYFLSDRHDCTFEATGSNGEEKQCIVCEMSRLFQEFYSGAQSPLVPHLLLHMTWQHAHHLAGYEQQDAHEFFIATLDLLHRHLIHRSDRRSDVACDCIVDTIFTGKLQSDVVCQSCRNVSTTIDPFWDISLDLPANNGGTLSGSGNGKGGGGGGSGGQAGHHNHQTSGQSGPAISLHDCLQRFTKPEYLGSAAKIKCSTCKAYQESTKQLTMKKLPIVASFHLKRFEHSTRLHKKISTRVAFPEHLDMTPFVSHQRNNDSPDAGCGSNMYTLFAVINHIGNIEAGHYTSYIRQYKNRWYRCNDHQIVPSTISEVLSSEGYLLFYHKQILEYQ